MSHAPSTALEHRHQAIRARLATDALDALVVTSLPNILYLTTFTGSSAIVVLTADRLAFLTDFRYVTAVRTIEQECPGFELVTVDGSYDAALARRLASLAPARVGFEAAHLTVARLGWLTASLADTASGAVTLVPTE